MLRKLVERLAELEALAAEPRFVVKRGFYSNAPIRALELRIAKPSVLRTIRRKLYAFYRKLDIYHADIEPVTGYLFERGVYPLARVRAACNSGPGAYIQSLELCEDPADCEYELPPLKTLKIETLYSHRLGISRNNPLLIEVGAKRRLLRENSLADVVRQLNEILRAEDPDILLSAYGDQMILPALFEAAQRVGLALNLDRDPVPNQRRILRKGSSYNTYGSWIYMAPSYPLFGRWHIDRANSFVYRESDLSGVIELARLSRMPVQKLSRSSTGAALTSIETHVALSLGYLAPWQKSSVEDEKTAYELLEADKGALIYVPDASESCVYENAAQLDYAQMYPSIMALHNVSPETVNCLCCPDAADAPGASTAAEQPMNSRVPEIGYRLCARRRGVVSLSLEELLRRRKIYKSRIKEIKTQLQNGTASFAERAALETERARLDSRQSSLKWTLVTSFGYLGYRNAKFGKIESHESVTAFGREKLLVAKELSESRGFRLLHAITDSVFILRDGAALDRAELAELCGEISERARVEMSLEGVYSWLVFPPSRVDAAMTVVNRYFGRFTDGELKCRGLFSRRKDAPAFIRDAQLALLERMRRADSVAALRVMHGEQVELWRELDEQLRAQRVAWPELLLRKTASRELDQYAVRNGGFHAMHQLRELGVEISPGEKVRYLALVPGGRTPRYMAEERAQINYGTRSNPPIDANFYRKLLWQAFEEVWSYFAPAAFFAEFPDDQLRLALASEV